MVAKICVVVFAVSVLAPSAVFAISANEIGPCPHAVGIPHFNLSFACGKSFYGVFLSENANSVSCAVGNIQCPGDGTVTMNTKIFENGILSVEETSTLVDMGNGVVDRTMKTTAGPLHLTDIVTSFDHFYGGDIKMVYIVCRKSSDNVGHVKAAFVSTMKDADFTDNLNAFKQYNAVSTLAALPNGKDCNVKDYFP